MKKPLFAALAALTLAAAAFAADNPTSPLAQLQAAVKAGDAPAPLPRQEAQVSAIDHLKSDNRYWAIVYAADKYDRTALAAAGLDIVEMDATTASGFITLPEMDRLAQQGFIVKGRQTIYEYAKIHLKDFPAADAAYHNYAETVDELQKLAADNPAETSLFSLGKSVEGREIWCLRLNPAEKGETPSARPGAFFMGNHHAREHLTNEVALGLAAHLLARKNDPEIRRYLDTLDIYIVPMTNPDGAEYDIATGKYRWHRKNTRRNANNTIGVDLNRNYDSRWCQAGASTNPGSDTYCGPSAFSEPETQIIKRFVETRPNLTTLMSYHSYSDLLLYPWAGKDNPIENARDLKVYQALAKGMTAFTGYRPQQSSDLYVATGDTTDWAYENFGIFAFTTELEGGTFYPGAGAISKAVTNNVKAAVYLLSMADDPYKAAN